MRSFWRVAGDSPEILQKLCASTKLSHQKIKLWYFMQWNLHSEGHWQECFSRSSHGRCSVKNVFLEIHKNSQNSQEKHLSLCQSLFLNNVADLRSETLLKKRPWHRCFPVNFVKFPRTSFFTANLRRTASIFFIPCYFIDLLLYPLKTSENLKWFSDVSRGYRRDQHCVKSVCIRSNSGPHFPAFGLNTYSRIMYMNNYLSVFRMC